MMFSVIVVSLNAGDRLLGTVKSILSQTYQDYEIVVKDGCSSDGSLDSLPDDNRIKVFAKKDKSIYDAMNQAVKLCTGKYYLFLNCGDEFENIRVLSEMAKEIARTESKEIYYGDMRRRDTNGVIPSPRKITDFVCYRNIPCHQVCFYSKRMFEKRAYDTAFPVRADYEHFLWCRYVERAEMLYVPVIVCNYEGDGFSETKEHEKVAKAEHRIITKRYLGAKCILYKLIMIATLQPLRKLMSKTGFYQGIKRLVYGR